METSVIDNPILNNFKSYLIGICPIILDIDSKVLISCLSDNDINEVLLKFTNTNDVSTLIIGIPVNENNTG